MNCVLKDGPCANKQIDLPNDLLMFKIGDANTGIIHVYERSKGSFFTFEWVKSYRWR